VGHLGETAFTTFFVLPFIQVIDFITGLATTGAGVITGACTPDVAAGGAEEADGDGAGVGAVGASNFTFKVGEEYVKPLALR